MTEARVTIYLPVDFTLVLNLFLTLDFARILDLQLVNARLRPLRRVTVQNAFEPVPSVVAPCGLFFVTLPTALLPAICNPRQSLPHIVRAALYATFF